MATRSCSTTSTSRSCRRQDRRRRTERHGQVLAAKIMAQLDHANNGDAILDLDATVGMLRAGAALTKGKTRPGDVEEAVGKLKAKMKRLDDARHGDGPEPDARPRTSWNARRPALSRPSDDANHGTSRAGSTRPWTCCVARRPTCWSTTFRWRRRRVALEAALEEPDLPAPRRAHQPPGHRHDPVAREPHPLLAGRRAVHHPRPGLPRQARHAHLRARPGPPAQLPGQLRRVPGAQGEDARGRGDGQQALRQEAGRGGNLDPPGRQGAAAPEPEPGTAAGGPAGRVRLPADAPEPGADFHRDCRAVPAARSSRRSTCPRLPGRGAHQGLLLPDHARRPDRPPRATTAWARAPCCASCSASSRRGKA